MSLCCSSASAGFPFCQQFSADPPTTTNTEFNKICCECNAIEPVMHPSGVLALNASLPRA